jgi:hypothetical protein
MRNRPNPACVLPTAFAVTALTLLLACGGGGGSTAAPPFTLTVPALSLPVPPVANQPTTQSTAGNYPAPYVGTVTVTLNRSASFTGAVTLAIDSSTLPAGVKAQFADATIPAAGTSAVLSIQAGYPNPADNTDTEQIYPTQGKSSITIQGSSGSTTETATLALDLVQEPAAFTLLFTDPTGSTGEDYTSINLPPGSATTEYFLAAWSNGTYSTYGPVTMTLANVPAGLGVTLDNTEVQVTDTTPHTLTLTPAASLAPGTYSFLLTASFLGETQTLPVLVNYAPAPFDLQTPSGSTLYVAQGQTLNLPYFLWHDDGYFGTVEPTDGSDPSYVPGSQLSVTGVSPSTPQVSFANASTAAIEGQASVPLQVSAGSASVGTYSNLALVASRNGKSMSLPLTVVVTASGASPKLWIQNVEWGQTVVSPNLKLVAGKPALLRVHLLADRTGVAAPTVTATINGNAVTLTGPATVPTSILESDLPTASAASGSTYTAILPAATIQTGLSVAIQAGSASTTVTPAVDPGYTFNLTVVPVYVGGVAPVLPATATMTSELTAFWPVQSVNLTERAPYTSSTTVPAPTGNALQDTSADAWLELLNEMAALRIVDRSTDAYYGMFNPSLPANFTSTIAGLSLLGDGIGLGIDTATASLLENDDPSEDMATTVMVHEEGHAFNLNHAPGGGAAGPQLNFPYKNTFSSTTGGATGSWGFDPLTGTAYDPTLNFDIMSYVPTTHWVSDWNYTCALGFIGENESKATGLVAAQVATGDQYVVSGWIGPDHQAHLAPIVRANCPAHSPRAGNLSLVLETAAGTRSIAFASTPVPDLPAGHKHFCFTVPAGAELLSAEVKVPGSAQSLVAGGAPRMASARRQSLASLATRTRSLASAALDGSLVVQETGGTLHLQWDAQAHPYLDVIHEGSSRTTLALHLKGGSADLPVAALPPGGQFLLHFSDGLNTVVHVANR